MVATKNPYKHSSFLSRLLGWWLIPLFRDGSRSTFQKEDLFEPVKEDAASPLGDELLRYWEEELRIAKEKGNKKPSLFRALRRAFGWQFLLAWIPLGIAEGLMRPAQCYFLKQLLLASSEFGSDPWPWTAAVVAVGFSLTILFYPSIHRFARLAARCRVSCSSLIYRKELKLNNASMAKTSAGQLINLLSNDVQRFDYFLMYQPYLLLGPIQLVVVTYLLWEDFGWTLVPGMLLILVMCPAQFINIGLGARFRRELSTRTDSRARLMSEVIQSIRLIKLYAWERPFAEAIKKLRDYEVQKLQSRLYLAAGFRYFYSVSMKLVLFTTVVCFLWNGHILDATKIYFLVMMYQISIQTMAGFLPAAAAGLAEILVSIKRIQEFLVMDEKKESPHLLLEDCCKGEPVVCCNSVAASWNGEKWSLFLSKLMLEGDKTVVFIGPVGSGKTTFLHLLLGELRLTGGACSVHGRVSYASQESWIFAGTVKENILFEREYDENKYNEVVKAACLEEDFEQFPAGDETLVGERGITLSGGQKARVNLARCLYQDADIYLLDDPLSAVDTKVSRHLFEKGVKEYLKGKLRILVTHQLQYLPRADHIVLLVDGAIECQGTYEELLKSGVDFVPFMKPEEEKAVATVEASPPITKSKEKITVAAVEESIAEGGVSTEVYTDYFRSGEAPIFFFILLLLFFLGQFITGFCDWWMSVWTDADGTGIYERFGLLHERADYWHVYLGFICAMMVVNLLRVYGFYAYTIRISRIIHDRMFSNIVRAPTKFFDEHPSGRVMNRFTKDLGVVAEHLPNMIYDTTMCLSQVAGAVILVVLVCPYLFPAAVLLLFILNVLRHYYLKTSRAMKRIEGVTKSPVFTHTSTTLEGLMTIRSAKTEAVLTQRFDDYQDIHTSAAFLIYSSAHGFGMWVEQVAVFFLGFVSLGVVFMNGDDPSVVGLALSSVAMNLGYWFAFGMRQSAETENLMTSAERVLELTNIASEAELESTPETKPPRDWPSHGEIIFENVFLSYNGRDETLKDVCFSIKPGSKVGIVGRTGAGKSSIVQALFRLYEPRGRVLIDDVCVNEIGLHDLRKAITVIPQDPVLFQGNMRHNLDPFQQYTDDELWRVLEQVELKHVTSSLDAPVTDLSLGQRQLLCLARAILRGTKIIVMDEATANVDPQTDKLIQYTIDTQFESCTVIIIAHRLDTVMGCDKIIVMQNGCLKEQGPPNFLLQDEDGIFTSMVKHTGLSISK